MINDNKLLCNNMIEQWEKVGNYVNDVGGMATEIKEIIAKMSCSIKFRLMKKHKNKEHDFNNHTLRNLMEPCNDKSRRVLNDIKNRNEDRNMVKFGKWNIRVNNKAMCMPAS